MSLMAESRGVAEEIVSSLAMIFVKNEDRMSSIDAICLVLVAMLSIADSFRLQRYTFIS